MTIAHDPNHNLSSGGATYECLPVAPELVRILVTEYYKHSAPLALRSENADSN